MEVARKKSMTLFVAVAVLLIAQVGWWMFVFLDDVDVIARLKTESLHLRAKVSAVNFVSEEQKIAHSAARRRLMFLSEGITFAGLSCFGIYLLYRAFHVEAKAREIERNFIEVVTHESKTPLTAMKLRLESLATKIGKDEGPSRELKLALEEVRRLSSIFDKAMSLNRLEREALSFEVISVAEAVRQVLRRMEPLLTSRQIECQIQMDDEACVRGDLFALINVVQSLLENAVFYNDSPQRRLGVSVAREHGRVVVRVSDNGPGIDEQDRPRIFERFYRGKHGHGTSGVSGTGLGLYLARTLVHAHNGSLTLTKGRAEGSEFIIELPEVAA